MWSQTCRIKSTPENPVENLDVSNGLRICHQVKPCEDVVHTSRPNIKLQGKPLRMACALLAPRTAALFRRQASHEARCCAAQPVCSASAFGM